MCDAAAAADGVEEGEKGERVGPCWSCEEAEKVVGSAARCRMESWFAALGWRNRYAFPATISIKKSKADWSKWYLHSNSSQINEEYKNIINKYLAVNQPACVFVSAWQWPHELCTT